QKAKEKRTQARTARTDAPVCRNNCDPFETISSLFIKVIPFVNVGTSILLMHRFGQQKSQEGSNRGKDRHLNPAGNGNRTRMASLEGWNFTIKLCPRGDVSCRVPVPLPSDFRSGPCPPLIFPPPRSS